MELRSWFESIAIEEVDIAFLKDFHSRPAQMIEHGNKVYSLKGADWQGFIVGGIVAVKEDDGDFSAPGELLSPDRT